MSNCVSEGSHGVAQEDAAYLLPITVRVSPADGVERSNFVEDTPYSIETTIT